MYSNIIADKSLKFSIDIVNLYKKIPFSQHDLSRQLLRSATSIGANVKEGSKAISRAEFNNKMSIALKEANETEYWLQLMSATNIIDKESSEKLLKSCSELCKILNAIVKTALHNSITK